METSETERKSLRKIKKYIYCTSKHLLILKIILTDVDLCINASISKWIIRKHNFSLPLLTSNVPFSIKKSTLRGTCIPGCEPLVLYYLRIGFKAGVTKLLRQNSEIYLHMMLSLKIKIKDIHHCKETDHVYAIVRTGHGQPTWYIPATWFRQACWWPLV